MKSYEEIMEILEAFALTSSYRAAGELAGCSHHTVEHWVTMRDNGVLPDGVTPPERVKLIDGFMPKIEEWVERSNGRVRGDVVFDKLVGLGYAGSDRTVRRALAAVKLNWRADRRRVFRPWVVEPGMWAQWDWGHGPKIGGRQTYLFCAWLAWCRFRVVLPVWDKTLPTVISCLDRSMRAFGGVPTYWLTDNEKTVSTGHVAGIAARHPLIVQVGHHYGVTVTTCVPADPETKGGVERTVQIAKADLVPTDTNLLDNYGSWVELVEACAGFMVKVNDREHRITRRAPIEMLTEEQTRLHRLPDAAFTAAFGETRKVSWTSTISFRVSRIRFRTPSPIRSCGSVSMATRSSPPTSLPPVRSRSPATRGRHRGTRALTTPTARPAQPVLSLGNRSRRTQPKPSSWASAKGHGCGSSKPPQLAHRG